MYIRSACMYIVHVCVHSLCLGRISKGSACFFLFVYSCKATKTHSFNEQVPGPTNHQVQISQVFFYRPPKSRKDYYKDATHGRDHQHI